MKKIALLAIVSFFVSTTTTTNFAQCSGTNGSGFDPSGRPCSGPVRTAVPFLRINPDARSGAMGDVGIAISPDANAMHFNASKLAFADQDFGASLTYTPWLRSIGVTDINLLYLSGFKRFGGSGAKQAVGFAVRYFSLGSIQWTDISGSPLGEGRPNEWEAAVSYSRQLSQYLSVGITGKFIYSNLATGQSPDGGGAPISSGIAGAGDFSLTYRRPYKTPNGDAVLTIGGGISNIGNKMTYSRAADFLPTNLGIGGAYEMPFDKFNSIVFALDLNKPLTPSADSTGTWRDASAVGGILKSFGDARGGFSEEIQEINYSLGLEYWYDKQFAVRAGYFYENISKGGRQYMTFGLGLKYSVVSINMSYLVQTSSGRSPLDNTLRFSLLFNSAIFKDTEE